jgi:hypothetical protein
VNFQTAGCLAGVLRANGYAIANPKVCAHILRDEVGSLAGRTRCGVLSGRRMLAPAFVDAVKE